MTNRNNDNFRNYHEIEARRSSIGACGHGIGIGERIGWNPKNGHTICAPCWTRWTLENDQAELAERCGY